MYLLNRGKGILGQPTSVINIPSAFFSMLPFLVTCVILVISSIRMHRENQQPHACGVNYFRRNADGHASPNIFKKKMKKVVSLKVKACILSTGESQGK